MAGNFWQSSHCAQWVLDKVDLARERKGDLEVLTDDEYCKIMIFYSSFIQVLGEQLKLRQQVNRRELFRVRDVNFLTEIYTPVYFLGKN